MMKRIEDLIRDFAGADAAPASLAGCPVRLGRPNKVNIIALGDVGTTMLTGLILLGGEVISEIGIFDISEKNTARLEIEMNQIRYPFTGSLRDDACNESGAGDADRKKTADPRCLPKVKAVSERELFDCDMLVFCASKGVPPVGEGGDVRMAQLSANRELVKYYGKLAAAADGGTGFKGLIAVVSDPVDPLALCMLRASGLKPWQVQGCGLGVMNARALYYAEKDERFARYSAEGRAFGPHGADLVIADSVTDYDDVLSRELTEMAITANLKVRDLGYKPYIAPAVSSAAITLILTLKGEWNYSSVYIGTETDGAFLGIKNRVTADGREYEDLPLSDELYARIKKAYEGLRQLG